jgi:HEPN domain-containing protein
MQDAEPALTVAREWLAKAENDLLTATQTLKLGRRSPTDTVSFHAQQCVEKCLKALLVLRGAEFPKTHDLELLAARLRNGPELAVSLDELARLKRYATVTRYPGAEAIALADARKAVAAARKIRRAVRALVPKRRTRKRREP